MNEKNKPSEKEYKIVQVFGLEDISMVVEAAGRDDLKNNKEVLVKIFKEVETRWQNAVISDLSDNTVWDIVVDLEARGEINV